MVKYCLSTILALAFYGLLVFISSGCAQMGYPSGGPKDSLAPVLIKATPEINTINFSGNKITLLFNEYIDIQNIQNNLLVSPLPQNDETLHQKPGETAFPCPKQQGVRAQNAINQHQIVGVLPAEKQPQQSGIHGVTELPFLARAKKGKRWRCTGPRR